jgi:hypothetical protein
MATNIKVTLEADISKYQQGLRDATAAADKFTQTVNKGTAGAEAGLNKLATSAGAVTGAMAKIATAADTAALRANNLVTALSGLAAGAFINSLLQGASASKDMSDAFGLSIESVLELQAAFAAAGRGPEKLNQALATLSDTAVGALQGNYALRSSFEKLGISMADLQNKSAKEIIAQIADTMTSGNASAAQLAATYDILGKSAKGLPWGDLKDKLAAVNGTMGQAADATRTFDEIMKKLEASAGAVKKEFMILVTPVADFLNEFIGKGDNAKLIAEGLAGAMALIAGATIISGLKTVVGIVTGLAGAFGLSTAATGAAAAATNSLTQAEVLYLRVKQAEAAARAESLAATVAETRARLAEIGTYEAGTVAAAEYAAAKRALLIASGQLAAAEASAAAAAAGVATASAAAGTATAGAAVGATTAAGAFSAMATAALAAARAVVFLLGRVAIIATTVIGINEAVKAAFSVDPIDYFATKLEKLVKENFPNLYAALEKVGAWFGMAPGKFNEAAKAMESGADRLKRLGVTPSEAGAGRGTQGMPQAQAGAGVMVAGQMAATGDKPVAAGVQALNPMAAQEESLRRQLELLKLQNDQQESKLKLQLQLVGVGEEAKALAQAELDFKQKQTIEVFRLNTEIAKLQQQAANEPGGAGKYGAQIELLKKQRDYIAQQKDDTSELTAAIVAAGQAEQMRLFYIDQQTKSKNQLKDLERSIADFNRSEDDRRLSALQNMIALEQEAAVKKRQDQLGNKPIGDQERLDIMQKIAAMYDPLIAKQKEYNAALAASEAAKFAMDLQNKAIENQISLTAEMSKLTQTADQQRITDLNTQLELMARQEIVRRQSMLAPGQTLDAQQQAAIRQQVFAANEALLKQTQAIIDKSREFTTGWEQAFNQYKEDANNSANQAKIYFDTFTKGFEDAFVQFVQTGKFNIKDLANTMIAEFARIQAKKLASGILNFDFTGSFSGASGGGGLFGGLFGGLGDFFGGLFASGGNPPMGKASIVGENGPELFVPRNAGTIIPNSQIGGGGDQTYVTYNIQATDAASFKQMIAQDPKFLHAVVEKGRRSLPQGAMR